MLAPFTDQDAEVQGLSNLPRQVAGRGPPFWEPLLRTRALNHLAGEEN